MRRIAFNPLPTLAAAVFFTGCGLTMAQLAPPVASTQPAKNADDRIKILVPETNKKEGSIAIPAAFWNQKMTSWVEVALCGRPSDFLHETIACITTTKDQMNKSLREVGFRDADFWVANVQDFPRIRGDRALVLLEATMDGKKQTFALDELLCFQGWGVPAGPYGWMYKGDPERDVRAGEKKEESNEPEADRTKIIRDDPQIALAFKGLQHLSQSYIDHPLAYDNWVYPMMRYGRNYKIVPEKVYDSNGDVPVTLIIKKVNEVQFLTEIAKVWHDESFSKYVLEQLPTAKRIDEDKSKLEKLLPEIKALLKVSPEKRDPPAEDKVFGTAAVLAANIESGYAKLDAAWAIWAQERPVYESTNNAELDELKAQSRLWREHRELMRDRAAFLATAESVALEAKMIPADSKNKIAILRGQEIEARSRATLAEIKHPTAYWKYEKSRINPKDDPRTDWINHIAIQNDLMAARETLANAGIAYGIALQVKKTPAELLPIQRRYADALTNLATIELRLELADIDFEISKRELIENDVDLPALKERKKQIETRLKEAVANTQPGAK